MAFPFQGVPPDLAKIMRRPRLRMAGPVTVKKCRQMRQIRRPVTLGRILWLLDGQKDGGAGRGKRRERSRMQFIGHVISKRVVLNGGHAPFS